MNYMETTQEKPINILYICQGNNNDVVCMFCKESIKAKTYYYTDVFKARIYWCEKCNETHKCNSRMNK